MVSLSIAGNINSLPTSGSLSYTIKRTDQTSSFSVIILDSIQFEIFKSKGYGYTYYPELSRLKVTQAIFVPYHFRAEMAPGATLMFVIKNENTIFDLPIIYNISLTEDLVPSSVTQTIVQWWIILAFLAPILIIIAVIIAIYRCCCRGDQHHYTLVTKVPPSTTNSVQFVPLTGTTILQTQQQIPQQVGNVQMVQPFVQTVMSNLPPGYVGNIQPLQNT